MTAQQTETDHALLTDLVLALINYPQDLRITARPLTDGDGRHWRTDWTIQPNINDAGKIIGKKGAHVKALKRVMELLGERKGMRYVLRVDNGAGERQPEIERQPAGPAFSPADHHDLLLRLLEAILDETPAVEGTATPGAVMVFLFRIKAANRRDDELLAEVPAIGLSLVDALAVLFKAAGHRAGAYFKVEKA